jgi:hypothetical protein
LSHCTPAEAMKNGAISSLPILKGTISTD